MLHELPNPGDLILVEKSEWYALSDGGRLRVCENVDWIARGEGLFVAPRHQVRTFWGPNHGLPDGNRPEQMSTSGGPFKTIMLSELDGLNRVGTVTDTFWCWQDYSRAGGGVERIVDVALWKLPLLIDEHHRRCREYTRISIDHNDGSS